MNKYFRIIGATCLMVIYCFAVSVLGNVSIVLEDESHSGHEQYFTTVSDDFYSHTSESKNSNSTAGNAPISNSNASSNDLYAIAKSAEQLSIAKFKQYRIFSKNFPIQYRKTDIIFPFHYFW